MGENLRAELRRRGVDKEIVTSDGTCIVHDTFDVLSLSLSRRRFPGIKVVAHPECAPEVAAAADFVGSTGAMMKYVKGTNAPYFLMLTECGLVDRLQVEAPEKTFVGGCRLCPYMKLNLLENVLRALKSPTRDQVITLDEAVRARAARCIERMFELAPRD
jgi:quinolinate synthase